jgi:hypothetical protein
MARVVLGQLRKQVLGRPRVRVKLVAVGRAEELGAHVAQERAEVVQVDVAVCVCRVEEGVRSGGRGGQDRGATVLGEARWVEHVYMA